MEFKMSSCFSIQVVFYTKMYLNLNSYYLLKDSLLIKTGYDINSPVPMVLDFHGWGGDSNFQERDSQDCSSIS